jgi:hypothetical protein
MSGGHTGLVVTDPSSIPTTPGMLGSPQGLFQSIFGSTGSGGGPAPSSITQVTGVDGKTMYDASGNLNSDPSTSLGAAPFAPMTGDGSSPGAAANQRAPMVVLPKGVGPFTVSTTGDASGSDTHTLVSRGFAAQLGTTDAAGVANKLSFDPGVGAGMSTSASNTPLTVTLVGSSGAARNVVELTTTTFKGGSDHVSFSHGGSGLSFVHSGRPTFYTLTLSHQGGPGAAGTFETGRLRVGRGEHVTISSIHWGHLAGNGAAVKINGRVVRNAYRPRVRLRVGAIRIKRHGRGFELGIAALVGKLGAGDKLVIGWIIRHGDRVIAHGATAVQGDQRATTVSLKAPANGHYVVTAEVSVLTTTGYTTSAVTASARKRF